MGDPAGRHGARLTVDEPISAVAVGSTDEHDVVHVVLRAEINLQPVVRDVQGRARLCYYIRSFRFTMYIITP